MVRHAGRIYEKTQESFRLICNPSLQIKSTAGQSSGHMGIQTLMRALFHCKSIASILYLCGIDPSLFHAFQSYGVEQCSTKGKAHVLCPVSKVHKAHATLSDTAPWPYIKYEESSHFSRV
jgi:anti-anti-sigma regulatory factor